MEKYKSLMLNIQNSLIENHQNIQELETEKERLEAWHQAQLAQVEQFFNMVLEQLSTAKDSLLSQLSVELARAETRLSKKEQEMSGSYLDLIPELSKIQEIVTAGGLHLSQYSPELCYQKVATLQSFTPIGAITYPKFRPATTLSKLHQADFGFLQTAEFLPEHFSVRLSSPPASFLEVGSKVICSVVTTKNFTEAIRANIKIMIRNEFSNDSVPLCLEDFIVSDDKKSLDISILMVQPGAHTVSVLLYDQNVMHSPLSLNVTFPSTSRQERESNLILRDWNDIQKQQKVPKFREAVNREHLPVGHPPHNYFNVQEVDLHNSPGHHIFQVSEKHSANLIHIVTPKTSLTNRRSPKYNFFPKDITATVHKDTSNINHCDSSSPCSLQDMEVDVRYQQKKSNVKTIERLDQEQLGLRKGKPETCIERGEFQSREDGTTQQEHRPNFNRQIADSTSRISRHAQPSNMASQDVRMIPHYNKKQIFHRPLWTEASRPPQCEPHQHHRSNAISSISRFYHVKPSPPVSSVNLVTMLSPVQYKVCKMTLCLESPICDHRSLSSIVKPIGICLLKDKCIVVASTFEHKVKMFTGCGQFVREVMSGPDGLGFRRPSDMVALGDGGFAVRDEEGIRVYDNCGKFQRNLDCYYMNRFYGLAEDGAGHLITINENKGKQEKVKQLGTKVGEADLLYFSLHTGELVKRIELSDVILDKKMSKCRFLTWGHGKLIITDLGLDRVYILDPVTKGVQMFGKHGAGPGCFNDPAGLAVDTVGNMIVADSRNHRVCLHDKVGLFLTEVALDPPVRRPSGLLLDPENGDLYVLNLQGEQAVVRYSLQ